MNKYDFIFSGGGLSGSMLLYYFLQSKLKDRKFLLIDKNLHARPYRQWSYWMNRETPFDEITTKQWKALAVHFPNMSQVAPLQKYTISLLESSNYYSFIDKELKRFPNVECREEEVVNVQPHLRFPSVQTMNHEYVADFVFDSTYQKNSDVYSPQLFMQGLGVLVTTRKKVFDPTVITFMDYRHAPQNELLFFYVMPLSETQAFIDVAQITDTPAEEVATKHEKLLHTYLENNYRIEQYSLTMKKFEIIPLYTVPGKRQRGKRVLKIGAAGGLIKQTTSYGFTNILKDSEMITDSFRRYGEVRNLFSPSRMSKHIDAAMMELMLQNPIAVKNMYRELFGKSVNGDTILAYLSDELSTLESIKLITRVNPKPMAEIFKQRVVRKLFIGDR